MDQSSVTYLRDCDITEPTDISWESFVADKTSRDVVYFKSIQNELMNIRERTENLEDCTTLDSAYFTIQELINIRLGQK